jgi:hypothetical protein
LHKIRKRNQISKNIVHIIGAMQDTLMRNNLQDIAPRALVRAFMLGSDLKFVNSGSSPLDSMTSCWLFGLFCTTVLTTSAAFARMPACEFFK